MSYEEVGIRLRTDGVVESTTGVNLMEAALQGLGRQAGAVSPALGGVGQQAAAMARGMTPLGGAIASVAVASGALAVAWYKGSLEAQAYQRAIILTGNAAGETAGNLQEVARRVDTIVGTQAQAAAILAQLVSTGNVSRAQLEQGTQAAINLQRTFGIEADKTVAALSAIGRDPVRGLAKLNEQYRFLTLSTWEQVTALAAQGRMQEAAAVGQDAFSKTANERSKEMEQNLGTLQKMWRAVGETAAQAWSNMLGVGRADTTQSQLNDVRQKIKLLDGSDQARIGSPEGIRTDPEAKAEIANLRLHEAALQEMLRLEQRAAGLQAQRTALVETKIEQDLKKTRPGRAAARDSFDNFDALGVFIGIKERQQTERDRARENDPLGDFASRQLDSQRRRDERAEALKIRAAEETAAHLQELEQRRLAALRPQWIEMVAEWNDVQLEMRRSADDTMFATLRSAEDAWVRWATTGKLSIRDVFATFMAEQARAGFRQLVGQGLSWLMGGSGGSAVGNGAGELIDFGTGSSFPARAGGGDVQAGHAYMVGEKGPELLFMGRQSGSIMNNDQLAGSGGGRQVVFAPVFNVDARTDKAEILQILHRGMQAAQADLLEKMDRREI